MELRAQLAAQLVALGIAVVPGIINCIFCRLPPESPDAATIVEECRRRNLFIRDAAAMGTQLGSHMLRVAVKDAPTNARIITIPGEETGPDEKVLLRREACSVFPADLFGTVR
jgi:histidinol-phosphate/aromatic aminotransferase/cobyric acid decarboxylase-like protein